MLNKMQKAPVVYTVLFSIVYGLSWFYNGTWVALLSLSSIFLVWWLLHTIVFRIQSGTWVFPRGWLLPFSILWIAWLFSTILWSSNAYTSWFYAWEIGSIPMMALLYWFSEQRLQGVLWRYIWAVLLASTVGLVVWAGVQEWSWLSMGLNAIYIRPQGPLLDTNSFSAWLLMLYYVIASAWVVADTNRQNISVFSRKADARSTAVLLLLGLLSTVFIWTDSRGWMLTWACSMPLWSYFVYRVTHTVRYSLTLLGLVLVAFICFGDIHNFNMLLNLAPQYVGTHISTVSRWLMWKATWHMYLSHPWTGVGLGAYFLFYPHFRMVGEWVSAGTYDHNDYLQFLAEGGPINLLFIVLLPLLSLFWGWKQWKVWKIEHNNSHILEVIGLVTALFAIAGFAAGNFIYYNYPIAIITGLFLGRLAYISLDSVTVQDALTTIMRPSLWKLSLGILSVVLSGYLLLDSVDYVLFNYTPVSQLARKSSFWYSLDESAAVLSMAVSPSITAPYTIIANDFLNTFYYYREHTSHVHVHHIKHMEAYLLSSALKTLALYPTFPDVSNWTLEGYLYQKYGTLLGLSPKQAYTKALHYYRITQYWDPENWKNTWDLAELTYVMGGKTPESAEKGLSILQQAEKHAILKSSVFMDKFNYAMAEWDWLGDKKRSERDIIQGIHSTHNPAYWSAWSQLLQREIHSAS